MSFLNHEVWANGTTPLFLTNPTSNIQTNTITLAGSPPLVLSNDAGTLTENGVLSPPTSLWSTLPATSNTIYMNLSNIITTAGGYLYFNSNILAYAGDVSNVGDWALYPQVSNINGNGKSIISNSGLTSTGIISTTNQVQTPLISNSNVTITASSTITENSGVHTINVDRGVDVGGLSAYSVTAQNGSAGVINMTANAGFSNATYGTINMTANGSSVAGVGQGGLINIQANTPISTSYTLTSAIKMSAAGILSYAGAITPLLSLAGYNYLYGSLGVNITANVVPPSLAIPNTAGTIFLSGQAGTKCSNGFYVDEIRNYQGQDLTISTPTFSGSNGNISINSSKQLYLTATTGTGGIINMDGNTNNINGGAGGLKLTANAGGQLQLSNIDNSITLDPYGDIVASGTGDMYFSSSSNNVTISAPKQLTLAGAGSSDMFIATDGSIYVRSPTHNINLYGASNSAMEFNNAGHIQLYTPSNSIDIVGSNGVTTYGGGGSYYGINSAGYINFQAPNQNINIESPNYVTLRGRNASVLETQPSGNIYAQTPNATTSFFGASNSLIQLQNNGVVYLRASSNVMLLQGAGTNALTLTTSNVYVSGSSNIDLLHIKYDAPYTTLTPTSTNGTQVVEANANPSGTSGVSTLYATGNYGGSILGGLEQGVSGLLTLNVLDSGTMTTAIDMRPTQVKMLKTLNMSNNTISNVSAISYGGNMNITSTGTNFYGAVGMNATLYMNSNTINDVSALTYPGNMGLTAGNITITSTGTNFYGPVGIHNTLYMNNNSIRDITSIFASSSTGSNFDLYGGGVGHYLTLNNAGGYIQIANDGNVYLGGSSSVSIQTQAYFNAPASFGFLVSMYSNLDMNYHYINNAAVITSSSNMTISAPGNAITIDATNIIQKGNVSRNIGVTNIAQPVFQYGEFTATGSSGSNVVNLTTPYTASNTYIASATMMDSVPARMSVERVTASQIIVHWAQAGGTGTQYIGWSTMGT